MNDSLRPNTTTVVWGGLCGAVVGWIAAVTGASFVLLAALRGGLLGGGPGSLAPGLRDAAAAPSGHLPVGGLAGPPPPAVAARAPPAGGPLPGGGCPMVVVLAGLVLASAGEGYLVDRRIAAGTVLARVDATTPRTRQFLFHFLASAAVLYGVDLVFAAETDLFVILVGAVTSAVFVGDDDQELVVLEDGLVVGRSEGTSGTLLPWGTVDAVTADEGTSRLRQWVPPLPRRGGGGRGGGGRRGGGGARAGGGGGGGGVGRPRSTDSPSVVRVRLTLRRSSASDRFPVSRLQVSSSERRPSRRAPQRGRRPAGARECRARTTQRDRRRPVGRPPRPCRLS